MELEEAPLERWSRSGSQMALSSSCCSALSPVNDLSSLFKGKRPLFVS